MRFVFAVLFALLIMRFVSADATTTPATNPATAELTKTSSIDEILDALNARGADFKTFTADVKHTETTTDFGNSTTKSGKVWYEDQGDGKARIHVHFDSLQKNDSKPTPELFDVVLTDGKVIERVYHDHMQTTRQVTRPGEKVNLLKLGEGPFPLPIGQPKEEVFKQFDVKKIDPAKDDPPATVHVQLVPKPDTRFARKFKTIDVWVDCKTHMPIRVMTRDRNETMDGTTDLSNVQINPPLNDANFALEKIDPSKWNITDEAYQE